MVNVVILGIMTARIVKNKIIYVFFPKTKITHETFDFIQKLRKKKKNIK